MKCTIKFIYLLFLLSFPVMPGWYHRKIFKNSAELYENVMTALVGIMFFLFVKPGRFSLSKMGPLYTTRKIVPVLCTIYIPPSNNPENRPGGSLTM